MKEPVQQKSIKHYAPGEVQTPTAGKIDPGTSGGAVRGLSHMTSKYAGGDSISGAEGLLVYGCVFVFCIIGMWMAAAVLDYLISQL